MKIVFFDGYCGLCNGLVDWLIKIDKNGEIKFASLQGETANKFLCKDSEPPDGNTIIYLKNNRRYYRSTAILLILSDVGRIWKIAKLFFVVPKSIRDFIYVVVATRRYRFFGKMDTCRVPTTEERKRLLP